MESSSGTILLVFLSRVLLWWKGAKDLLDDGLDLILLVLGVAPMDVLDTSAQNSEVLRAHIQDHDGLALGEIVWTELLNQPVDGEAIVGDGLLGERVGRCPQILEQLMRESVAGHMAN